MGMFGSRGIDRLCRRLAISLLAVLPLSAAYAETDPDPFEGVNRAIFRFNDTLDTYALKPVAKGYQKIAPQFVEDGVSNFFGNIGDVRSLTHDLLQAKFHAAGVDTGRLLVNTTFGLLGVVDVASRMGLARNDEDFGQTLGVWGVPSGPYVVVPLLGPRTVRDGLAGIPDGYLQPYPYMEHVPTRNVVRGADLIDTRASLLKVERMISGDKYLFIRNAYLQTREFKVRDGQVEDDF